MGSEEFVKKVKVRAQKQYMCERGSTRGGRLNQAKRECLDKERCRLFCHGHPLGGMFLEGARYQVSEL